MATAVRNKKHAVAYSEAPKFRNWGVTLKGIVVREVKETYLVDRYEEATAKGLAEAWALREFLLTYSQE